MDSPKLTNWIDLEKIDKSYDYWNNEEIEKKKIFYLKDDVDNFSKFSKNKHMQELSSELNQVIKINKIDLDKKKIFALGCGTSWVESKVLSQFNFDNLRLLDFSKHRIFSLAPKTVKLNINNLSKVEFIHGNMYDLKINDNSVDCFILVQAFHHADNPIYLLDSIKNKLKKNGIVIISGEPNFGFFSSLKYIAYHFIKFIINHKRYRLFHNFIPGYSDIFPPDQLKGDNHYSKFQYHLFFNKFNFSYKTYISKSKNTKSFILFNNV